MLLLGLTQYQAINVAAWLTAVAGLDMREEDTALNMLTRQMAAIRGT